MKIQKNKSFFSTSKLPRIPKTSETLLHIMNSDGMERERERERERYAQMEVEKRKKKRKTFRKV